MTFNSLTTKSENRIDAIGATCSCAEKAVNDSRKVYALGTFHTPGIIPPMDKVQVAKLKSKRKFCEKLQILVKVRIGFK